MRYRPTFDEFAALAPGHGLVPVYRQLTGDTLTPVTAFRKVQVEGPAFLFESVVGGERQGRYSFVGSAPFLTLSAVGTRLTVRDSAGTRTTESPDPLRALEDLLANYRAPHLPGLPRFLGGAVGYTGYDTVRYVERLPHPPADDRGLPDLAFGLYDQMVVFDHVNKTIAAVAHAHVPSPLSRLCGRGDGGEGLDLKSQISDRQATLTPVPSPAKPGEGGNTDLRAAYDAACLRVDRLVERLQQGVADLQLTDIDADRTAPVTRPYESNVTRAAFEAAVARAKEYIQAGDIFQVVLSQRLKAATRARPFDIYRALRVVNPSPFVFYLDAGPCTLIGASPEIMARVEAGRVTVRPLAGTRPRGRTDDEDARLAAELLADPKERAEHIMLVDLGRNDVGRVARFGTVQLADVLSVERYSHVMHLCSTVTGELLPALTAFDALRSCLPAGTLSGAPKVRAMQIIDELEPHRRGPYGGAVGYIDFSGNMDTCIALRTLVLQGQTAYLQAGAGIVADSDPAAEYQETLNKAMGLLRAIELAETQL